MTVSIIFDEPPIQWGLRGDPYLWDELKEHYRGNELPYSQDEFTHDFHKLFKEICGDELGETKRTFVKRFAKTGMSAGQLSHIFWKEKGLPLLVSRLEVANKENALGKK